MSDQAYKATDPAKLRADFLDPCTPVDEKTWWARRHIEELEAKVQFAADELFEKTAALAHKHKRITELEAMATFVISNILTDSQLDTRLPCGQHIRSWKALRGDKEETE